MVRNNILRFLAISFFIALSSCVDKQLSEVDLYTFLKDESNHLIHQKEIDPFGVSLMYKPSELVASQEITQQSSSAEIDSIEAKYQQYIYFVLNYSYNGGDLLRPFAGDRGKYSELVNQLSFGLREKISIVTDKSKRISLADFVYSRHYGLGDGTQVILAFKREEIFQQSEQSFKVKLKDIGIGIGQVSFNLKTDDIKNCPKLNR